MDGTYILGYIIGLLIWSVIWGCITQHVNESKGYYGGFAWGFWLGLIGLIVVACKPTVPSSTYQSSSYGKSDYDDRLSAFAREKENKVIGDSVLSSGGWRCVSCGRSNYDYVTMCPCGQSKDENSILQGKSREEVEIEKAQKMLDKGIITQEEYEAKRKKILGI